MADSDRAIGDAVKNRILFAARTCYLDTHNGASVASRSLMECLSRRGFSTAAISGTALESGAYLESHEWPRQQGFESEAADDERGPATQPDHRAEFPTSYRMDVRGVQVELHRSTAIWQHEPDEFETREFLALYEAILDEFRPGAVVNFGGDGLAAQIRRRARDRGIAVVFSLHNFNYRDRSAFKEADAVMVPSRFAASYYRKSLGLDCTPLPYLVDVDRARAVAREPRFVTFVNPSYEKGVFVFAKIADELGKRRPDIPLLVVEGRGTERTLVDCGIDLRAHRNVSLMGHTPDPRHFWGVTRIALMPSLWWENQPLVAIEAMLNGIPVIGSDRGGIPEALGDAGIVLGIPPRITPATRELPTADEVRHWVKAIISLWDDQDWYADMSRRALAEFGRWAPEVLEPQYVEFFQNLTARKLVVSGDS